MEKTVQIWAGLATVLAVALAYLQFFTTEPPASAGEIAEAYAQLAPTEIVVTLEQIANSAPSVAETREDAKRISDAANSLTQNLIEQFPTTNPTDKAFRFAVTEGVFQLFEGEGTLLSPKTDGPRIPIAFRELNKTGSIKGTLDISLAGNFERMRIGDEFPVLDKDRNRTACSVFLIGQGTNESEKIAADFLFQCS